MRLGPTAAEKVVQGREVHGRLYRFGFGCGDVVGFVVKFVNLSVDLRQ